jgi:hypothetical protein|mmetsp:Transcript_88747/g.147445  ORF Transcript_88747/g.147445 Transcript_88747/m.147445 type:complete len:625 (+) Transcript_88747:153-2027(+)
MAKNTSTSASQPEADRVIPLLCHELLSKSQPFQQLNLKAFEQNFKSLQRCLVLVRDAEFLLAVLFKILARDNATTELMNQQNALVAGLALRVLHRLFVERHRHFEVFLTALRNIMTRLCLTDEYFYRRPPLTEKDLNNGDTIRKLTPPKDVEVPTAPDAVLNAETTTEEESMASIIENTDISNLTAENFFISLQEKIKENAHLLPDDADADEAEGTGADAGEVVTAANEARGRDALKSLGLTENITEISLADLYILKAGFDDMDLNESNAISFNELMDYSEATGIPFTHKTFKKVDRDGNGLITFMELLRAWFPKVSVKELERKVAQLPSSAEIKIRREKEQLAAERQQKKKQKQLTAQSQAEEQVKWQQDLEAKRRAEILKKDNDREQRWSGYCQTTKAKITSAPQGDTAPRSIVVGTVHLLPADFYLDAHLENRETRAMAVDLLMVWDLSSLNVSYFVEKPTIHLYLPHRFNKRACVFRDYVSAGPRPVTHVPWDGYQHSHVKTNIPMKSDIMYRFVVEGYNYGVNAPIHSDVVGYTHRRWNKLGAMEDFGWPEGWDQNTSNNYAKGANISQYFSSDGFVVIKLTAKSLLFSGFSVTAYVLNHDYGANFVVMSEVIHSDTDL